MLNVYRTEVRRSPVLTALPVLIAVDLLVLFGRTRYWIGVWPEASAAAQVVTLFLGPALAALAAWQAGRGSRADMPESLLVAARPHWQIESARLAATLTLGFAAYAVGCLVAAGVSLADAGPGFLWPSYLLMGSATLTMFAAVGHLAGRRWPSAAFTPVVGALGGFVVMMGTGQAFGLFVLSGTPDQMLRPRPIALHLALAFALLACAVLAPPPRRTTGGLPRRPAPVVRRLAGTTAAAGAVLALIALPAAGEARTDRPATTVQPLCGTVAKDSTRVCVWPEHRKYLADLSGMADHMASVPQQWIRMPHLMTEYGLRRTPLGDPGFDVTEGHVRTAAIAMSNSVFYTSFSHCAPPVNERKRAPWQLAKDRITLWLEYRAMAEDPSRADEGLSMSGVSQAQREAAAMVRRPESEQRQWIDQQIRTLGKSGCRP
ncbi:DUF7224 domain-containing protein [Streptomyces sp. NPDC003236]|uniref:DUF7224 domain-containing protein n=1 Tax=Streptomyces sp. NPDC093248 TaxID=3155072 RepID=UPI003424E1B0